MGLTPGVVRPVPIGTAREGAGSPDRRPRSPGTALRSIRRLLILGPLVTAAPAAGQEHQHGGHGDAPVLGTVTFPNSGSPAAQAPFLRGVAFLHSFEYEQAAAAFREAQHADPGFALAYWMEALTFSHVLWGTEDLRASRAALQRLAPAAAQRLAKAGSARERTFGEAVEAFYAEGTLAARVGRYAGAMRRHARGDPGDLEAAAFAAHALLLEAAVRPNGRDEVITREAIALAQKVAQANPDHPGAAHYLIHAYDTPGLAAEGLPFARAYDKIAPDAEHALHMPSHIYLQLGLWADVVHSNERAWAASRATGDPDWHAFAWLQYAYLQQGRFAAAKGLIDTVAVVYGRRTSEYADATFVLPRLQFQYAAETGNWQTPITPPRLSGAAPASDRERAFRASARYWLALDAVLRRESGAVAAAAPFLAQADSARAGAAVGPRVAANAFLVEALVALSRGDRVGMRRSLESAAEQERNLTAFVGPPERVFALERLGELLMDEGRWDDAQRAYRDVLALCPQRSQALLGLASAQWGAADQAGAEATLAQLEINWADADPEVRAMLQRGP